MSLIHYLTIGRFSDALTVSQRTALDDADLARLERVLREEWQLTVALREFVNDGVLRIQYTGEGPYLVAWPTAFVARETLRLSVVERGHTYSDATIRARAERCRAANAETRALVGIEDSGERVRAIADEIRAGRRLSDDGHELLVGLGPEVVSALVPLLADEPAVQFFACQALEAQGKAAAPAIPALEALLRRKDLDELLPEYAVMALATMGPAAESALLAALEHPVARDAALEALEAIPDLDPRTRSQMAVVRKRT